MSIRLENGKVLETIELEDRLIIQRTPACCWCKYAAKEDTYRYHCRLAFLPMWGMEFCSNFEPDEERYKLAYKRMSI